jgi:hypothetical protein
MTTNKVVRAPQLDIDKILFKEANGIPHERCRVERRVVANLIAHLDRAGFKLRSVFDGEDTEKVSTMKEAMEAIFNLDEAWLRVRKEGFNLHTIFLTLGEGRDAVCDHSFSESDHDGFRRAMDTFEAGLYAIDFDEPFENLSEEDRFYLEDEEEARELGMDARAYFKHLKEGIDA